jgi:hypothetical protein
METIVIMHVFFLLFVSQDDVPARDCLVRDLLNEVNTSTDSHIVTTPSTQSTPVTSSSSSSLFSSAPSSRSDSKPQTLPQQRDSQAQPEVSITTVKEVFTNLILAGTHQLIEFERSYSLHINMYQGCG